MSLPTIPPWPTDESQPQHPEAHPHNTEPDPAITYPLDFDFDVFFDLTNTENLPGGTLNDEDLMSTDVGQGPGSITKDAMVDVLNFDPRLQNEFGFDVTFPEIHNDLSEVMVHWHVFANL